MVRKVKSKWLLTGLAALLPGCAVGPNYQKPQTWTPPKWRSTQVANGKNDSTTVPDAPDVAWWNVFHDAELTSLEDRVASQNLDIQRATEELAQSRT
ncbi:hypothetical protein [Acetobacter oeni]|uniref:RND transporter n=1 Tax=Acetobacter oeni TaxID=304077 RepID=A0A511XL81_9PROT|nr:hypothetical protein [Acetobacter oeni]MBB3883905.1 outer membrane protein TolC [Acetobacter oeni]GBR02612.1 hypothetical protein AA21952_0809 [Acetobacter oeni LMG 21952]GEN63713.1 hypothetical protein AOE01nite_19370 [Acetobacter oeni]